MVILVNEPLNFKYYNFNSLNDLDFLSILLYPHQNRNHSSDLVH